MKPGDVFERWTVIRLVSVGRMARCRCVCGAVRIVYRCHLTSAKSKSCGCLRAEVIAKLKTTHGLMRRGAKHPLASVWSSMIQRCTNPKLHNFKHYGGRGITVCERWRALANFVADMEKLGPRPPGTSIDRINNDGNYEPGNVRWATALQQIHNRQPLTHRTGDHK